MLRKIMSCFDLRNEQQWCATNNDGPRERRMSRKSHESILKRRSQQSRCTIDSIVNFFTTGLRLHERLCPNASHLSSISLFVVRVFILRRTRPSGVHLVRHSYGLRRFLAKKNQRPKTSQCFHRAICIALNL